MDSFTILNQIQLISCAMMVAVIWIIQILHYPTFFYINESDFSKFHEFHSSRITWIVAPLMFLELVSASFLWYLEMNSIFYRLNLVLAIFVWFVTFFVSVPIHNQLLKGKDLNQIKRLVFTNWIRTGVWTFRFGLCFFLSQV
ncbi:hypothetical protein EHQ96_00995 [Leptospira levettii]|uniref:hypothetical protein n=1 Tax=Leptospira levettii TaxID=2023178 RepID=UPI00108271DE|nr:hypothetical protein [Leptospira levettii]TGM73506.1 hypothetical protein EHQ96_00995 [Leptospira levettii]